MTSAHHRTADLLEKTRSFRGVRAGIVEFRSVLSGPSYRDSSVKRVISRPSNDTGMMKRLSGARWVLILGLYHPARSPEMDWWQGNNTPGNRRLTEITAQMSEWLFETMGLRAQSLPYQVEKGGLFQKDAAVLSGIGIVGRNNLLLHPDWGPRIRFRSMLVSGDLVPTQPVEGFDPCADCDRFCQSACPQNAFSQGRFNRDRCLIQMRKDESKPMRTHQRNKGGRENQIVRYCRECELACPIGLPDIA